MPRHGIYRVRPAPPAEQEYGNPIEEYNYRYPLRYTLRHTNPWSAAYTDVGARAKHLSETPFPPDLYPEREAPDVSHRRAQGLAGQMGAESPYQYAQALTGGVDLAKKATGPVNMHAYMMPYLAHVGEELARNMRATHEPIAAEMHKKFNTAHPKSMHKDLGARLNSDLEKEIEIQKQLAMAQGWESAANLSRQDELRKLVGSELLGKSGIDKQRAHIHNINVLSDNANLARAEEQGARQHLVDKGMKILGYPFDLLNRYNRIVRGLPLEYGIDAVRGGDMANRTRDAQEAVREAFNAQQAPEIKRAHQEAKEQQEDADKLAREERARIAQQQAGAGGLGAIGRMMEGLARAAPEVPREHGAGPEAVAAWRARMDREHAQLLGRQEAERQREVGGILAKEKAFEAEAARNPAYAALMAQQQMQRNTQIEEALRNAELGVQYGIYAKAPEAKKLRELERHFARELGGILGGPRLTAAEHSLMLQRALANRLADPELARRALPAEAAQPARAEPPVRPAGPAQAAGAAGAQPARPAPAEAAQPRRPVYDAVQAAKDRAATERAEGVRLNYDAMIRRGVPPWKAEREAEEFQRALEAELQRPPAPAAAAPPPPPPAPRRGMFGRR